MASTETFSIEAIVCGYHVYQGIWDPALGEQLRAWEPSRTLCCCGGEIATDGICFKSGP